MKSKQKLLTIIGPSGTGKSLVVHELLKRNGSLRIIPTWTDRPKRATEEEIEHRFVSTEEFDDLIAQDFFLEVVTPFKLPYRYGYSRLSQESPHTIPIIMLRAEYVSLLNKYFDTYCIYQIEADNRKAKAAAHLDNQLATGTRLSQFEKEIQAGRALADRVYVNTYEDPLGLVAQIEEDIKTDFR